MQNAELCRVKSRNQNVVKTHDMNNHDMTCYDRSHDTCYDNTSTTCIHDMRKNENALENVDNYFSDCRYQTLSKNDWWLLVNTLEGWNVYNPRSVVKKNPQLAWRIMNICKDPCVRVKGAYFTTCFKRELYKLENAEKLEYWRKVARQKLGIA